jgi:hypothetical protein
VRGVVENIGSPNQEKTQFDKTGRAKVKVVTPDTSHHMNMIRWPTPISGFDQTKTIFEPTSEWLQARNPHPILYDTGAMVTVTNYIGLTKLLHPD